MIKETMRVVEHKLSELGNEIYEVTLQLERDPLADKDGPGFEDLPLAVMSVFIANPRLISAMKLGNAFYLELTPVPE